MLVYLARTMKQVYAAHKREVCLLCLWRRIPVVCAQLCWEPKRIFHSVNIVWQSALPLTLCAICVAVFYIHSSIAHNVSASHFCPGSGLLWASWFTEATGADFLFSENIAVLAAGYPGDDREALRSLVVAHDVRRFGFACILVIYTIFDAMSSNAQFLQLDGQPTTLPVTTLTVPSGVHTLTPGVRWGAVVCGQISTKCSLVTTKALAV